MSDDKGTKCRRKIDNVGGLGEHVTCHLFRFVSTPFFLSFYFILGIAPSPHWWTDFDDLYVIRRVSAQGSAFWGRDDIHVTPHLGGQIAPPPKEIGGGASIGVFKPKSRNGKSCILSKLLY